MVETNQNIRIDTELKRFAENTRQILRDRDPKMSDEQLNENIERNVKGWRKAIENNPQAIEKLSKINDNDDKRLEVQRELKRFAENTRQILGKSDPKMSDEQIKENVDRNVEGWRKAIEKDPKALGKLRGLNNTDDKRLRSEDNRFAVIPSDLKEQMSQYKMAQADNVRLATEQGGSGINAGNAMSPKTNTVA